MLNSAEQALTRFAHCVLTANVGLPHASICEAIGLAIGLVPHIARDAGRRRVTELVAVRGYDARTHLCPRHALLKTEPSVARLGTPAVSTSRADHCAATAAVPEI